MRGTVQKNDERFVRPGDEERLKGSPADRRYRRVRVHLPVRFLLPDGIERHGHVTDLSVRGAAVASPPAAIVGDAIVLHVGDVGRLAGKVAGLHDKGFGVMLAGSKEERQFLADALTVLLHPESSFKRAMRFSNENETVLETDSGLRAFGRIVDLSETGASIATAMFPALGERVRIGRKRGTVVRHTPGGIGVTFRRDDPQTEKTHG